MQTPKHINERLRVLIDHFTQGNAAAFAREIKVVQQGFDRLLKQNKTNWRYPTVKPEIIDKILIKYPHVNKIWLLSGAGTMLRILEDPQETLSSVPPSDLTHSYDQTVLSHFYLPVAINEKLTKLSEASGKSHSRIVSELIEQANL